MALFVMGDKVSTASLGSWCSCCNYI